MLDEHFRIGGRTTWYASIEQMQGDLGTNLHRYNHERPHQSRLMQDRTPAQMFELRVVEQAPEIFTGRLNRVAARGRSQYRSTLTPNAHTVPA